MFVDYKATFKNIADSDKLGKFGKLKTLCYLKHFLLLLLFMHFLQHSLEPKSTEFIQLIIMICQAIKLSFPQSLTYILELSPTVKLLPILGKR